MTLLRTEEIKVARDPFEPECRPIDAGLRSDRDEPDRPGVQISPTWYHVIIIKVENGWRIQIGCKEFVSTSWSEICNALNEYWEDPLATQKKYCKQLYAGRGGNGRRKLREYPKVHGYSGFKYSRAGFDSLPPVFSN